MILRKQTSRSCNGENSENGEAAATHRTTFAPNEATVARIRRLAAQWQVSQAEVIRRVVASTDVTEKADPVAMLETLHRTGGGLLADEAKSYLSAVHADCKRWRRE